MDHLFQQMPHGVLVSPPAALAVPAPSALSVQLGLPLGLLFVLAHLILSICFAAQPLGADYVYISTNDSAYQNAVDANGVAEFVCAVCGTPFAFAESRGLPAVSKKVQRLQDGLLLVIELWRVSQVYGAADQGSLYSLIANADASSAELDASEQAALKSIYTKYAIPQIWSAFAAQGCCFKLT